MRDFEQSIIINEKIKLEERFEFRTIFSEEAIRGGRGKRDSTGQEDMPEGRLFRKRLADGTNAA